MRMKYIIELFTIFLFTFTFVSIPVNADPAGRDMGCSPTVANPCTGGSSGGSSGSSSGASALGQAMGQMIGEALRGNPEDDAIGKAEADATHRHAEEEELKRQEEKKNRLLGSMMEIGDSL